MQVVVIGRNYSSLLGMIRAAGMAGCPVTVLRVVKKLTEKNQNERVSVIRSSKYVKEQFFAEQTPESLAEVLLSKCAKQGEKQVVLPTDDFAASTIDLNYDRLKEYFYLPNIRGTQGGVVRMMDKDLQKSIAEKAGLNVAKGWIVNIEGGKYSIPADIEYPVFTKPEISIQFNKKCMKKCENEAELRGVLDDVAAQADCPILAEQFIEIEKEYAVVGVSDGTVSAIPGIITVGSMGHGAHKGVTLDGIYSSLSSFGELKRKLQGFMKEFCFTGLFDIDLYENNGTVYFNELNLRLGASGFAAVRAGFNLPGMLIAHLTENKAVEDADYDGRIHFMNEKVNLDDYAAGFISWKQFREYERSADVGFIKDPDDPKPYKAYKAFAAKARVRGFLK